MRVLFNRNIGAVDAARYGVPFGQCRDGDETEVSRHVSDELLARGLAMEVAAAPVAEVAITTQETSASEADKKAVHKPKAGQKPAELHK